ANLGACRATATAVARFDCRHRTKRGRAAQPARGGWACALPRLSKRERPALVCVAQRHEVDHRRARRRAQYRLRDLPGRRRRRSPRRPLGGVAAMNLATTPRRSASVVLALLLVAYIFNYLDRQILGILAAPIIADLHLNDRQFGLLSGPPFAILY